MMSPESGAESSHESRLGCKRLQHRHHVWTRFWGQGQAQRRDPPHGGASTRVVCVHRLLDILRAESGIKKIA